MSAQEFSAVMSFGPGFSTQDQPASPLSPSTNYYAGIGVSIMFLLGVMLIVIRLRARGRKYRRVSPPAVVARKAGTTPIRFLKKPEEARRQSA